MTPRAGSRIVSFGHHQPATLLTNEQLAEMVDTNDEWIRTRTGIVTRHVAADDETVADMAAAASKWWHAGKVPGDQTALLFGFGGGFAYASMVVRTPRLPV